MSEDSEKRNSRFTTALIFVLGLLAGMIIWQRFLVRDYSHKGRSGQTVIQYQPGNKLGSIMSVIEANYVDTINEEKVTKAGLEAVLRSLDPHSVYLPAQDFVQAEEEIQGNFQGIGVQFRMINDTVTVIMPISGGPSEKVGIQAGDRIIIAGTDTLSGRGLHTDKIVKTLKGPKGTKVKLGLSRPGTPDLVWVEVKRGVIPTYSVDAAFEVEPGIGYVKVSKFSATTYDEFAAAVRKLDKQGVETLIVDLRANGGGLLGSCLQMADMFLFRGQEILYTEGRNRRRTGISATGNGRYQNMNLVILIDEWSASASEIFAGAMQDNDRAVVIGRRSFGKGLVQEQMELSDGSALRLTVARYYTPTGRCIQKSYEGGYEDYEEELMRRYLSGEMTGTDTSFNYDEAEKFYTPRGRVVYGGGGILPDMVIPYKTDTLFAYQNRLSNSGAIYDFSFNYVSQHRAALKKQYGSAEIFTRGFEVSDALFEELLEYGETKGVKRHPASIAKYGDDMRLTLKALIGRSLYDDAAFYPTYLLRDDDFKAAMELCHGERKVEF